MSDFKYTAAYIIPGLFFLSIGWGGWMAYSVVVFSFVIVPLLELLISPDPANLSEEQREKRLSNQLFDVLLYLNLPIVFGAIVAFALNFDAMQVYERVGFTFSLGILMGGNGINVAHELGHRKKKWERVLGQILLMPSLYMHFYIEHNRGHHNRVGTLEDPATARRGETIFAFWWRSILQGARHAWVLEKYRLHQSGRSAWSLSNMMLWYFFIQACYLTIVYILFGPEILLALVISAFISILLLECINYVEHYGLMRSELENGRYERVSSSHSWNSNHRLGRIILYELTRHSDHHYRASKKYQVLDHQDQSPQLPYGYPTSIILSLLPPIWFSIMDERINGDEVNAHEHIQS